MSEWLHSIVMIIPAELRDKANRLACALGHDADPGRTFSVALSGDGGSPASHYGCRTAAKQDFVDLVADASVGSIPNLPWDDYGLSAQDIDDVLAALVMDIRPAGEMMGHFDEVVAGQGLSRVEVTP